MKGSEANIVILGVIVQPNMAHFNHVLTTFIDAFRF